MLRKFVTVLFLCAILALLGTFALMSLHVAAFTSSAAPSPTDTASQPQRHHLVRIGQLDPAQYASRAEYREWAYSTCSTAALAEVFNYYGHRYRIHDVLVVQAQIHEITPELGLVEDAGIAATAAHFGFTTRWGYRLTLDQILQLANAGTPVIVGWPPERYPGGHLVVIIGGNSHTVFLADSSRYDRSSLSRTQFMKWWAGFSAIVTPAAKGGQV
jgi:Peptidase C39 family